MSHFSQLRNHQTHVLTAYRHALRNINSQLHSGSLQNDLKRLLSEKLKQNKHNKSSWSVREHLIRLDSLNDDITNYNLEKVTALLEPHNRRVTNNGIDKIVNELETMKGEQVANAIQDPEHITQMNILSRYCERRQIKGYLPKEIRKDYKMKLLLPLAIHNDSLYKLNRLKEQMEKGPPQAVLSNTTAGKSKIWFVRSAINKNSRQSRKLGTWIRQARLKHQSELDNIAKCHEYYGPWAIHEAHWEHYLASGQLSDKGMDMMTLEKFMNQKHRCKDHALKSVYSEWLEPLRDVIKDLEMQSERRSDKFETYKRNVIIDGGQLEYYQEKTNEMYQNRKKRFDSMMRSKVPYVQPFYGPTNTLRMVLKRYKFL